VDLATLETFIGRGLTHSPLPAVIFDPALRIAWANKAAERMSNGVPAAGWHGRRLGEVMPGMDTALIEQSLRQVLVTGEPVMDLEVNCCADGARGPDQVWSCIQFRLDGPDDETAGVIHMMREITERARYQRRLVLADELSARIGTTLDTTQTARELLDVVVPRLADVGAIDLLTVVIDGQLPTRQAPGDKMHLQRVALRWPHDCPAPPDYARSTWLVTDPAKPYHRHLIAGSPTFEPEFVAMSIEQLREMDSGTGLARMLAAREAGAHSLIVLPLTARGVIMGLVVLYRLGGSKPFTRADFALASDVVSRAAVSIDNARLYTRERASALALQRGMLPRQIPEVAGLEIAYRYAPAQAAAEIGGDWFDVIPLSRDRCALIVGDVTGHDMRAASLMGQLRTATRTLATFGLTPSEILTRLDQITADLTDEETAATCVYAVYDAATEDWDIARAGHPLPAVVRPGQNATFLHLPPGMPLGTGVGGGRYQTIRLRIPRRSTVVMYTDGLVESPAIDMSTGMTSLARVLTTIGQQPLKEACDMLLTALAPNPADDIAILMART
jgi:Stage II sporulation protein E (SpoIIE)/PAS fold/GAF domain